MRKRYKHNEMHHSAFTNLPKKTRYKLKLGVQYALVVIFILIGVLFLLRKPINQQAISYISSKAIEKKVVNPSNTTARKASYNFNEVKNNPTMVNTTKLLVKDDDTNIIGKIKIPSVNLELGIFEGLDNSLLMQGAGTMKPEVMGQGNYVLAGHNVDNHKLLFSPLKQVKVGEFITVENADTVFKYKITIKKDISNTEISWIDDVPGQNLITLITCSSPQKNEQQRIVVRGELIDQKTLQSK